MDTVTAKNKPGRQPGHRLKPEFEVLRKKAFARARCQARFRNEFWDLDFEDYCRVMTPERWQRRGRSSDSLCLCMYDWSEGWRRGNVALLTRTQMLKQSRAKEHGYDYTEFWQDAIWIE